MRLLRRQAERGNAEAMTCLAVDHMDLQNFDEAMRWFRKAADLGFPEAQYMLGSVYDGDYGKGVEKDSVEAVRWYRLAADQGDATAQSALAAVVWFSSAFKAESLTRSLAEKYAEDLQWFLSVAEVGDGDVLLNVANLYSTGAGVPQDSTEALRWYRLAADKGNEEALCFIGKMYATGDGVDQDFSEAKRWYQLAAERGNAGAMFNIGMMYVRSQGVSLDKHELGFWFYLCSQCSLPQAQESFVQEVFTTKFGPDSLVEIRERAQRWIETHPKIHFR